MFGFTQATSWLLVGYYALYAPCYFRTFLPTLGMLYVYDVLFALIFGICFWIRSYLYGFLVDLLLSLADEFSSLVC